MSQHYKEIFVSENSIFIIIEALPYDLLG